MTISTIARIVLVMLLWASCFPLITTGITYAPHLTFAALRAILAGAALTILALALGHRFPQDRRTWLLVTIIGLGATSLGFLGMFHAAEFVSPGIATVIANTQPLLAAVLAGVMLNERLTARGMIGLGLGFLGIIIIASFQSNYGGQDSYALGVAYIILAALGITISNVMIKKISDTVNALMAMGLQMLIGSIPLVLGAWVMENPRDIQWSLTFGTTLILLSLFGTSLVYYLWFSLLRTVPLSQANAFSFLIPIFGLTMGVVFWDELLTWPQLLGIAFSILGVSLVSLYGTPGDTTEGKA